MIEEKVSLIELKKLAVAYLEDASPLRHLILSEADQLPKGEALIKIGIFSRLLERELKYAT